MGLQHEGHGSADSQHDGHGSTVAPSQHPSQQLNRRHSTGLQHESHGSTDSQHDSHGRTATSSQHRRSGVASPRRKHLRHLPLQRRLHASSAAVTTTPSLPSQHLFQPRPAAHATNAMPMPLAPATLASCSHRPARNTGNPVQHLLTSVLAGSQLRRPPCLAAAAEPLLR